MLTILGILAVLLFGYWTLKSIAYEIRKGHSAHVDTEPQTVRVVAAHHQQIGSRR